MRQAWPGVMGEQVAGGMAMGGMGDGMRVDGCQSRGRWRISTSRRAQLGARDPLT
jgi:hypothetical protein